MIEKYMDIRTRRQTTLDKVAGDESGMAMALAVIMILLIGVMGAGLLTFVSTDLNSVVETNRGQEAFEMADAGIKAAELQLDQRSEPGLYNGNAGGSDPADVRWSHCFGNTPAACSAAGYVPTGVTLNDLDNDGATSDSVIVTIRNCAVSGSGCDTLPDAANAFKVVSTGQYGPAKRKIEAVFKKRFGSGGIPAYYTPGDITFKDISDHHAKDFHIEGVSFFSGSDILMHHLGSGDGANYNAGRFEVKANSADRLGNWNNPPWNTAIRKKKPPDTDNYTAAGFAAEGFICWGAGTCSESRSIGNGWQGYDSTTATEGNNLQFVSKSPPDGPNAAGTISYPFPRLTPDAEHLKSLAQSDPDGSRYVNGASSINWDSLYPDASIKGKRVVFLDLNGETVTLERVGTPYGSNGDQGDSTEVFGILAVRCGNLRLNESFTGMIMLMKGSGSGCENTANFVNVGNDEHIGGYVYAEGSIELTDHAHLKKLPATAPGVSANYDTELLNLAYGGAASSGVDVLTWREVYE